MNGGIHLRTKIVLFVKGKKMKTSTTIEKMLLEVLEDVKKDPKFAAWLGGWFLFLIVYITLGGFRVYHNWYLTTPERWADPFNWIYGLSACAIYLILFYIGKKIT